MDDHGTHPVKPKAANDPLAKFPAEAVAAHRRFVETRDPAALDVVVLAVIRDFQSEPGELTDTARLIEDLGFDSLALAEIVFFIEDLYSVRITNQEIARIATVGDLRVFVREKLAALPDP